MRKEVQETRGKIKRDGEDEGPGLSAGMLFCFALLRRRLFCSLNADVPLWERKRVVVCYVRVTEIRGKGGQRGRIREGGGAK